jgi:hypothetical protein
MISHNKQDYTRKIIDLLKDNPDNPWRNQDEERLLFSWFLTGRQGEGLRLTDSGKLAFEFANIEHFDIDFKLKRNTNNIDNSPSYMTFILELNKKIKHPFYVGSRIDEYRKKQPYIRLYDGKSAMMLALYGDIFEYLGSIKD